MTHANYGWNPADVTADPAVPIFGIILIIRYQNYNGQKGPHYGSIGLNIN